MSNRCGECRFYEGNKCSVTNCTTNAGNGACSRFSAYGRDHLDDVKRCSDCRFYTGNKCSVKNCATNGGNGACSRKATCR